MPFGLHPIWAIAVVLIVLILFGVGRLSGVGSALGRALKDFRRELNGDQQARKDAPPNSPKA